VSIALLIPARLAAAAEGVDQPAVPRAFDHRDLVDAAVDRSRFDAHRIGAFGLRVANLHVVDARRDRAVRVERGPSVPPPCSLNWFVMQTNGCSCGPERSVR
jgi:hypothetical protein